MPRTKLLKETAVIVEAFDQYYLMGKDRSLGKLAKQLKRRPAPSGTEDEGAQEG